MDRGTKTGCNMVHIRMASTLVFMHQAFAHLTVYLCVSAMRGGGEKASSQHTHNISDRYVIFFPILLVSAGEARRRFNRRGVKAKETGFYLRET